MKIMIVLDKLVGGGAERVAIIWANTFVQFDHEVIFLSNKNSLDKNICYEFNPKVKLEKYSEVGFDCTKNLINQYFPILFKIIVFFLRVKRLRCIIRANTPDVILGVMNYPSLLSFVASIGLGLNVIATEHSAFERPTYAQLNFIARFFKFYLNKLYPMVSILTEADKTVVLNFIFVPLNTIKKLRGIRENSFG